MTMRPDALISVIIATYNRPDALEAVVEACFAQSDRHVEIIIADDGSGEPTQACIARLQQRAPVPLRHAWQPDQGFRLAMARNQGILASHGEYIVLLDGDCIPQRDFIARHRALAQPGFMVTGSRILLDEAFTQRVLAERRDLHALGLGEKLALRARGHINKVLQLLFKLPDLGRVQKRFTWRRIKGCNMAAWRSDIDAVNGFDESFEGWGHEDADFVVRLFNAGIQRKDGAFATEVFHLWHRENARDEASSNRALVRRRADERTVRAARGLA
ncbi:glycosyltransferase family 2 protein [Massilia antarctica]|uniref:glycosyltransferase family 2 protein n=1 Tax=Massilia antarctica TaxID=2765360 RepID=UPI0006BE0A76|nr:glycosyltransferase family 2 protein [Massilia sp. H27-R4]CUI05333.1 Putative two-domain glycosyltransferase [Janthinobacterium sp. CG23_2]CUU29119.1 Putative two-domain glycosyltransferase [Janthinobacterium sp. CG23_2]